MILGKNPHKPLQRSVLSAAVWGVVLAAMPLAGAAITAQPAAAQGGLIQNVKVEGNQRIEGLTIMSYLGLKAGDSFSQADIDGSLKRLYNTGFFSDVKLMRSGDTLIVRVTENPLISQVAFEGNDRIDDESLLAEVELKARSILSRDKLQNDVKRILDIYRRAGRYNATVDPKVIQQDQNRVDLVYEITESEVAYIEHIDFIGNDNYSTGTLQDVIRSSEESWWNFLTDDDIYDPDRLQFDQELLRRFYTSEGYADFQVKSAHAELSPGKDAFYATFVIEEGPRYSVGKVDVISELKSKEEVDFSGEIVTEAGETYDSTEVEESVDSMIKKLGDMGYAFVDIQPQLERNKDSNTIDLTYVIKPGPRVYVERINITGNVRTLDEVVRREFRLSEGDPYNASQLQRSEQRLNNLGFFEKVEIKNEEGSAPDKTVVNVDVQEKSTGEINMGAGFSTTDGALADFGIKEKNLLGRGQELRTRVTYAARRKQFELGFTEPYFLNRELATGFDIYRINQEFQRESSFDSDVRGITLNMGYSLQEKLRHNITYTLRSTDITDIPSTASTYIQQQAGKNITSSMGHNITYDDRDNKFDPTTGYYLQATQEVAGLGGDSRYVMHELKSSYYYPLYPRWTLGFLGSGGYILGYSGRDVRINERFYVGGDDLRGFRSAGIGPRDTSTRDALGGNAYYTGTAELKFPLGLPEELGVTGAAFTDVGSLWQVDDTGANVFDNNSPRVSVGAGILWSSPFGPIRIDFAHAVIREDRDLTESIRFSFGTRF
ncbi:MAG: outer membrane protein assembly factor BamA [Alphaproteobacteria bacterium]